MTLNQSKDKRFEKKWRSEEQKQNRYEIEKTG